jgi:hypothetical protein
MVTKRGRKRITEMYFGPKEEEAVIKFLKLRYIKTVDFVSKKPNTIKHHLGKNVVISVNYVIPNENWYGSDSKFITVDVDVTTTNYTDTSVDIISDIDIPNANIIMSDDIERNLIFNEWLKAPLDKMIEAIIRKYKLYRKGETFEELHGDTVSFLMTKVHKFEPSLGKKAYSYFGTIAKHYILGLLIKDEKYMKQTAPYDMVSTEIETRDDLTYVIDADKFPMDEFIKKLSDGIKLELNDETQTSKKRLNDNERKVGYVLIEILENWETAFETMGGGSKYNKNSVLETMRNYTNLSTKDIRLAMKRYKELYELLKQYGL